MHIANKDDGSIYVTRGDTAYIRITCEKNGKPYTFQAGEVVRFNVCEKKNCDKVVLQKDFPVTTATSAADIILDSEDTKIGGIISKPTDYWYEVVLNPFDNPQTIIGYDADGTRVFRLFPEANDKPQPAPKPEVIKVIDTELDMTSERPVQNQVIARAFANLQEGYQKTHEAVSKLHVTPEMFGAVGDGVADDTEAFLRCASSGASIKLSNNKSYFLKDMEITNNVTLIGGHNSFVVGVLKVKGNAVFDGVKFKHSDTGSSFTVLVNGCVYAINCEFDGDNGTADSLLAIDGADFVVVDGCKFINNPKGRLGIKVVSSSNVVVCNSYFDNIGGSGVETFDVCEYVTIKDNVFTRCNTYRWGDAIDGVISTYGDTTGTGTTPSRFYTITGNKICEDGDVDGVAIRINGVDGCLVGGNIIVAKKTIGVFVQDRNHTTDGKNYIVPNKNVIISNNLIELNGDLTAINVFECDGIKIQGNTIKQNVDCTQSAIIVGRTTTAPTKPTTVEIKDNEIVSEHGDEYNYGILVRECDVLVISGNHLTAGRGVYVEKGNVWIKNNIIHSVSHNYIINCGTETKSCIVGNIYAYLKGSNASIVASGVSVVNENNFSDAGM